MIITTLRVVIPAAKRKDALEMLRCLSEPTQAKPGCISCRVYEDLSDGNTFTLVEEWESRAELDSHILSEEYTMILALMDISSSPPEIKFNVISHSVGMETIEAVRNPARTKQ